MIDLVLAGDNAVVIALAAAGLPATQRKRAIAIGISYRNRSPDRLGQCSNAIVADTGPLIRGRPPSPVGLLEDVARTSCEAR